jgi:hypothetical protein
MSTWLVYAIVALVVIVLAAVTWALIDRRRSHRVASEGERLQQPEAARRRSPR